MVKKYKVGSVNRKKDGNGSSIALGSKSKKLEYQTSVELIVRDGSGEVVAHLDTRKQDCYLQVNDPRVDKDGNPSKFADKIPDFVLKEITVIVADN